MILPVGTGRHDALYLSQGKHATVKRVAGIVALVGIVKHKFGVVDTHRDIGIDLLEYLHNLYQTRIKVRRLLEIAPRKGLADADVGKVGA